MDFDVVIAGAGPAGCIAGRDLARAGLRVAILEKEPRERLGKSIIVEVEKTAFDAAGLSRPQGDEVPYHARGMQVFSPRGRPAFRLEGEHPAVAIYLDRFVRGLLIQAEAAGAQFFGGHAVTAPLVAGGKVTGVGVRRNGRSEELRARLTLDATGFAAALVHRLDPALGIAFPDPAEDAVIAENHFHQVDPARAEQAVRQGLHGDEEIWNRLAFVGPYSTHYSFLSLREQRAYILIGFKVKYSAPPIGELIARHREQQGYFGAPLHGGQGLIRVRRSLDRLVVNGLMAIGEAACQVIPAHGSGVASALHAGRLAARVAAGALADGEASAERLWPYAGQYQRGRGAILATLDVNRLMAESLRPDQIADLMEAGAMTPEDLYNAAVPRALAMSPASLPGRLRGLLRHPGLLGPLVKMVRTSLAVQKHYAGYPERYSEAAVQAWEKENRRLFAVWGSA